MKKSLIDVVFFSEKRKKMILLLKDGPKEMETILRTLGTTRQALLPQIKILEAGHLIEHKEKDSYELTTIGNMLVDEMFPLMDTLTVFDSDIKFWGDHDLAFIPSHLLKRISELAPCEVVTNIPATSIYEPSELVLEKAKESKFQTSVTTFLFPNFASILEDFNEKGVKMYLIVSTNLLDKIKYEMDDVRKLLKKGPHELFLYPGKMGFASFGSNEFCFMMRLLTKTGDYNQKYVVACNPSALQWSKELFEHYRQNSTKVTDF